MKKFNKMVRFKKKFNKMGKLMVNYVDQLVEGLEIVDFLGVKLKFHLILNVVQSVFPIHCFF